MIQITCLAQCLAWHPVRLKSVATIINIVILVPWRQWVFRKVISYNLIVTFFFFLNLGCFGVFFLWSLKSSLIVFSECCVHDFNCERLTWNIKLMFLSDANPY